MAGTKLITEGTQSLYTSTRLASASNSQNSLEGLDPDVIPNRSICYVEADDLLYRWDDTSTATKDDYNIVRPSSLGAADPGRWFLIQANRATGVPGQLFAGAFTFANGTATTTAISAANTPTPIASTNGFIVVNASPDVSLNASTGVLTYTGSRILKTIRVSMHFGMAVEAPGNQDFRFFVDYNNQFVNPGPGSLLLPPWRAVSGRVTGFVEQFISNVSNGDTFQMKVINLTDGGDVSLLTTNAIQPVFYLQEIQSLVP